MGRSNRQTQTQLNAVQASNPNIKAGLPDWPPGGQISKIWPPGEPPGLLKNQLASWPPVGLLALYPIDGVKLTVFHHTN